MLEGRCQTYGVATPYLPFLDALRRGLHMHDDDTPAELLGKAVANVRAIDPALEQFLPSYLHLLSIQSDDYPLPSQLRGEELRRALAEAIAAILTLNSRLKPMVFVLEDWHWADEASEVVLNHLLGLLPSYPLMMIVVYRSDHVARWGHLGHHTPIVLKPLEVSNTGSIVKAKLDATELPDGLDFRIHEHTGGNPFFIEEVCNALV